MQLKQLLSYVRRAVDDYSMIDDGDKIAVGISGGKDSLTLLYALKELSRFYPKHFDIVAVSVDLGFGNIDFDKIREFSESLDVPYYVAETQIADIVFSERKEKNPCSLCAKLRKGAFNNMALELGCNKTAFGHHRDDIINIPLFSQNFPFFAECRL